MTSDSWPEAQREAVAWPREITMARWVRQRDSGRKFLAVPAPNGIGVDLLDRVFLWQGFATYREIGENYEFV